MKRLIIFSCLLSLSVAPLAHADLRGRMGIPERIARTTYDMAVESYDSITPGKPANVLLSIRNRYYHTALSPDELMSRDGKKLRVLVVDSGLKDFHIVYPEAQRMPGEFRFSFTPKTQANYLLFGEMALVLNGQQQILSTRLNPGSIFAPLLAEKLPVDAKENDSVTLSGITYKLEWDEPLDDDETTNGRLVISSKKGLELTAKEGALAQFAAFHERGNAVTYQRLNDMQKEGGNIILPVRFAPDKDGFYKIFVKLNINGKETTPAFGVNVAD